MSFQGQGQGTCDFEGTQADSEDCTSYYNCVEGRLFHYNCGSSSVFDNDLFSCVTPSAKHYNCNTRKALPLKATGSKIQVIHYIFNKICFGLKYCNVVKNIKTTYTHTNKREIVSVLNAFLENMY